MTTRERLIREWVKSIISEVSLSPAQIRKHGGKRMDVMLRKIESGDSFDTTDGRQIVILPNEELMSALRSHDADAVNDELKRSQFRDGGTVNSGMLLSLLQKTAEFGGRQKTAERVADKNESLFVATINDAVEREGMIDVHIGDYVAHDVISAEQTGAKSVGGNTSKADALLHTATGDPVRISIKMKTADYYLSGDKMLAPIVGPVIEQLVDRDPPDVRIEPAGNGAYRMVKGSKRSPQKINIRFDVEPQLAHDAVFGTEPNAVDIIAKGDLTVKPKTFPGVVAYPDVSVYTSIDDMPSEEQPIGLLRFNSGRGVTWNGTKYLDIRPVISTMRRAKKAVDADVN